MEKFIGDAVMAVFGAPVTHEDDAERAVRAGLRILEAIDELNEADPSLGLQVRIGVNTGEGVVALDARPELGEGIVAGDVVNTASRLQGVAPVDGVAVSEQTYRQTERVFEYDPLEPVVVKGKSEPLLTYRPVRARAGFGRDVIRTHTTPLVGRVLEQSLLIGTFERADQQRSCQLVTLVGEPGVGKSRMCAELLRHVDAQRDLIRWRQGRCLPYGDGIAFWALGEIVKAECGILESDTPSEASAKLGQTMPDADPESVWLLARLAPLVGAPAEPASQEESFAAWRRFCEGLAAARTTVLVFEDLHWADPALLAFLEHLADWAEGVPLLLLCTARPELYERHPTFGGNARNAQRINLAPLSDTETAQLVSALLERAVLPAETQQALLEQAGGNPLYAEEFVRLLADRAPLGQEVQVPESVQSLIAARLDTLPAERKSLLQDASVLGKVFWAGAVAAMAGRDRHEVELALHELTRKELVRPARMTSMEGEHEYGFWHVLVRDVCYGQIPRAARAARHLAAAGWIEEKAGERAEDLADVLAYHYQAALELNQAAGLGNNTEQLQAEVVRYLALAGDRALLLDIEQAERQLARALDLCRDDATERASLLDRWAQAAQQQGRLQDARQAFNQALDLYREQGELVAAGRVLTRLALVVHRLGDPGSEQLFAEARALLEEQPPGPELVSTYAYTAGRHTFANQYSETIESAERALTLASELNLPEPAFALHWRGVARCALGEAGGLEDVRQALQLALEQNLGREAAVIYGNLGGVVWSYRGPRAALDVFGEAIAFCERRGIAEMVLQTRSAIPTALADLGDTEQALAEAGPLADRIEASGDMSYVEPRALLVRLLAERGTPEEAPTTDALVAAVRGIGLPAFIAIAFAAVAQLLLAQGDRVQARDAAAGARRARRPAADYDESSLLPSLVRVALALDEGPLAARLAAAIQPVTPSSEHTLAAVRAQLAEAAGDAPRSGSVTPKRPTAGEVRQRSRACLCPPRPGPLPGRARRPGRRSAARRSVRPVCADGLQACTCRDGEATRGDGRKDGLSHRRLAAASRREPARLRAADIDHRDDAGRPATGVSNFLPSRD